jgi:integrase
MSLTDTSIKNAKPGEKQVKLSDEKGLFLLVSPTGGKWWRLKFRYGGKEKLLSLGTYPEVSLKDARQRRDDARKLLANGVDPGVNRKAVKAAKSESASNSFEVLAREWFAKKSPSWAKSNADKIIKRLENDAFPWLGDRPITEITAPELLKSLRRIEERGAIESAHRVRNYCGQIFRYAISTGRADRDPSADLKEAIATPVKVHRSAITDPKKSAELLRSIDSYQGTFVTKSALSLAPLFFVRPGELRKAEWAEFDLDSAEWNIPAERMKGWMRKGITNPHLVPLCTQAVSILRELQALTGHGKYVFPGARSHKRPMSDNAVLSALRRMGYEKDEMSGHGFRAMARTILDEVLGVRVDFIEHQLAHAVKDPNGRAYNRTAHLAERRKMMQQWADYLDKLKAGADVIPLHGKVA